MNPRVIGLCPDDPLAANRFSGLGCNTAKKGYAMKIKTSLAVIALTLAPTLALAEGCIHGRTQTSASQCTAGQVWNATTQACEAIVNS